MIKKTILSGAAVAAALTSSVAIAELSGNLGFVSDYYFRGIYQDTSSASVGLDWEHESGLYAGTWLGTVTEGIETDFYVGYAGEMDGFSYGIAYIIYDYTDDFDDRYSEVNLTAGYGPVSLEYAIGTYDDSPQGTDYTFVALSAEYNSVSITFGSFGDQFDGSYVELAYGMEVGGFDVGVSLLSNSEELDSAPNGAGGWRPVSTAGDGETTVIFSIGKGFDI